MASRVRKAKTATRTERYGGLGGQPEHQAHKYIIMNVMGCWGGGGRIVDEVGEGGSRVEERVCGKFREDAATRCNTHKICCITNDSLYSSQNKSLLFAPSFQHTVNGFVAASRGRPH